MPNIARQAGREVEGASLACCPKRPKSETKIIKKPAKTNSQTGLKAHQIPVPASISSLTPKIAILIPKS